VNHVELKPLTNIEAVDLVLSNCTKIITPLDVGKDLNIGLYNYLVKSDKITRCGGLP
jgi:hypothetical protein